MDLSDLQDMLEGVGVEVTRATGKEVYAHCPQPERHPNGDRRASWSINVDTGAHFCFSCGYRGSLRSLIEDITGEVPRDLDDVVKRSIIVRDGERAIAKRERKSEPEREPEIFISEYQLAAYDRVPKWACAERDLDPHDVDLYGVRWDGQTDRYIIPVRDLDNSLLGWQVKGRKYFKNVPDGMHKAKSLFGLDVFRGHTAILVESPLDAIRLQTAGIDGGLSSFGAHVSDDQMSMLIDVAETILLALDHDEAGRSSMLKIIADYERQTRLKIVRYRPDDPKDIGEMSDSQIHRLINRSVAVRGPHVYR